MSTAEDFLQEFQGHFVPRRFHPGFVVLSFIVSFVGAVSTLELINRRTSRSGLLNHAYLVSAAVTMGGISVWSMHFVGNRAIILAHNQPQLQIAYSSGFTAVSFFIPIIVLFTAFVATGTNNHVSFWRIGGGGSLAGGAICGMHYIGNASIANYHCQYKLGNVIGSAVIAVVACNVALVIFFVWRASWTNSWWKRGLSGVLLAGAVSGMHWCASTGTRYRLLKLNNVSEVSRNNVVTIIAVVSFAVALVVAFVVARGTWVARSNVSKAKHVVLAAAIFDRAGRILVSPDGLLPNEKITDTYVERTTSDTLSIENPIFQWMFQASRNWDDINGMIGNMTNHLMQLSGNGRGRSVRLMGENGQLTADYDVIFRELFCLAAVGLANRFKEQLSNVGVLWDDILPTGKARQYYPKENTGDGDSCERGDSTSIREPQGGWGSLMFLVRRLEHASDVEKFEAAGYRFADIRQVSGIIRSNMQIKTVNLSHTLANMATYAEQDTIEDSAVRLGFFGIRARLDGRGFDVLVEKGARNLLPASKLPLKRLEPWHASFLRQFDGLRMTLFQQSLRDASRTGSAEETEFISMLAGAISALRGRINDRIFNEATFSCRTIQVPCSSRPGSNAAEECTMIVIHFLMPIHFSPDNSGCEFIPLSFFKVYQMASRNSPYQAVFTQHLHREFLPAIKGIEATIHEPSHRSAQRGRQQSWYSRSQSLARDLYDRRPSILRSAVAEEGPIPTKMNKLSSNNSSRTILESPGLEKISTPDIPGTILAETSSGTNQRLQKVTSLGGILVSQEVKIAVSRAEETGTPPSRQGAPAGHNRKKTETDGQFEMGSLDPREQMVGQALGSTAAASGSAHEAMTFVDELFSACIESRWM